jgi:adenylate cyclase
MELSGRRLYRRMRALLILSLVSANLIGAVIVSALAVFVLPDVPSIGGSVLLSLAAIAAYVLIAVPIGIRRGSRRFRDVRKWLIEEREPDEREQHAVLSGPFRLSLTVGALWSLAALLFGLVDALNVPLNGLKTLIMVLFGGIVTSSISYLLAERISRPVAARAMAADGAARRHGLGVAWRMVLTWALATGVPVVGMVLLGVAALASDEHSQLELAIGVIALGGVSLLAGFVATLFAARATADPIVSVRRALASVERGDLDVAVPVYDGTEVGLLQAGFNRMAAGLRDRERLRDLFGRHVGEDVARAAMEGGRVELGGETREVGVLFVDLVGSTALAARRPPEEVVTLLNRFFAVVVEAVEEHGGSVNKFEGDAALAVFGAPVAMADPWTCTLRAARGLCSRLAAELPEVSAGIGVSGGEAVAGNVGAAHRFEYTVIGDPVNEAARLTEVAKALGVGAAASGALVERAASEERNRWRSHDAVELRGRESETQVWVPRVSPNSE